MRWAYKIYTKTQEWSDNNNNNKKIQNQNLWRVRDSSEILFFRLHKYNNNNNNNNPLMATSSSSSLGAFFSSTPFYFIPEQRLPHHNNKNLLSYRWWWREKRKKNFSMDNIQNEKKKKNKWMNESHLSATYISLFLYIYKWSIMNKYIFFSLVYECKTFFSRVWFIIFFHSFLIYSF